MSAEGVEKCVGGGGGGMGYWGRYEKVWLGGGKVRGKVWNSALGCGGR